MISQNIQDYCRKLGKKLAKEKTVIIRKFEPKDAHAEMKDFKKWFYSLGKPIETFIFYSRKDWQNVVLLDYEKMIVIGIVPTMGYSTEEIYDFFVKQKLEDYLKWNTKLDSEYYDCVYRGIIDVYEKENK